VPGPDGRRALSAAAAGRRGVPGAGIPLDAAGLSAPPGHAPGAARRGPSAPGRPRDRHRGAGISGVPSHRLAARRAARGGSPMTWIKTIPPEEAGPELKAALEAQHALYPKEYERQPGDTSESIVATHTLIPQALRHAFAAFGALMSPDLPLTRRQHEMITTVVSAVNRCHYSIDSHAEFLRRVTMDETLVEAIRKDFRTAAISEQDRVMLEYVETLTKDATRIGK